MKDDRASNFDVAVERQLAPTEASNKLFYPSIFGVAILLLLICISAPIKSSTGLSVRLKSFKKVYVSLEIADSRLYLRENSTNLMFTEDFPRIQSSAFELQMVGSCFAVQSSSLQWVAVSGNALIFIDGFS